MPVKPVSVRNLKNIFNFLWRTYHPLRCACLASRARSGKKKHWDMLLRFPVLVWKLHCYKIIIICAGNLYNVMFYMNANKKYFNYTFSSYIMHYPCNTKRSKTEQPKCFSHPKERKRIKKKKSLELNDQTTMESQTLNSYIKKLKISTY